MIKTRKRGLALLLVVAMVATMMIGIVPTASASSSYDALTVPTVSDDSWAKLGTVIVEVNMASIEAGDAVVMSLPSDFLFGEDDITVDDSVYSKYTISGDDDGELVISAPQYYNGDLNAFYNAGANEFDVDVLSDNQLRISVTDDYAEAAGDEVAVLKIEFNSTYVESGFDGDIKATFDAPTSSCFSSGEVVIATVPGSSVTISVVDDQTSNDEFNVTFRVKENKAGALKAEDETIKFILPDGFEWKGTNGDIDETIIWGDDLDLAYAIDEDEFAVNLTAPKSVNVTCFEFTATFQVADETDADLGDVTAKVKGESTVTPSELVVGRYGDFGATISVDGDAAEVYAGLEEQEIPDLLVEESIAGSLLVGRTVLLTLPSNARWQADLDDEELSDTDEDRGVSLEFAGFTGTDNRTAKFKVAGDESSSAAELTIEELEIATEAGKTGDIEIEVSGSAGLEGTLVVAKAVVPATIAIDGATTDLVIGKNNQPLPDIIITEAAAGAFVEDGTIKIDLPEGISFASTPTVEVTEGDADIAEYYRNDSAQTKDNQFSIVLDGDTDEASTIKVSNIKVYLDRTVPEGPVTAALAGSAVNQTGGAAGLTWPNARAAASVTAAKVVTSAPGEQTNSASFVIGSTTYTLNGVEQTMDVAPYIKGDRTFMPVRYVAYAMGVTEENVIWDEVAKTVTLMKGDKVVQLKIGSTTMLVNGVAITMDVAPEITSDRTMLPIRFLGNAFGAVTGWDAATNTVTIN